MPPALRLLLLELFGAAVDEVRIVEHSLFNTLHLRPLAVTRRNCIYLRGSREEFFAYPELVVHEYFHVLCQWRTGELTVWRYVVELFRRGYWENRYEVEARAFAARHRLRYARIAYAQRQTSSDSRR
jgi:hypothetical protein